MDSEFDEVMKGVCMNAYSIYDDKSGSYGVPFFASTDGLAIRSFADLLNDPQSVLFRHPKDFRLYRVAFFNLRNGYMQSIDVPLYVFSASDIEVPQADL